MIKDTHKRECQDVQGWEYPQRHDPPFQCRHCRHEVLNLWPEMIVIDGGVVLGIAKFGSDEFFQDRYCALQQFGENLTIAMTLHFHKIDPFLSHPPILCMEIDKDSDK